MAEKKRRGIKAQIKAERGRERRIATVIFLTIMLSCAGLCAYFAYPLLEHSPAPALNSNEAPLQFNPENTNANAEAAIVDQVSLSFPNETFVQTATRILEEANYSVDYYSGEKVTVDFFRNLPAHAYSIIILRVHSALMDGTLPPLALFTSEPYSEHAYVSEQLADEVGEASYVEGAQDGVFAIMPDFVRFCMNGTFQNSTIIMMGCNGMTYVDMAEALIERGARTCISWDGSVSASYTDQATTLLLKHLVTEGQTIKQAVANTIEEVGPDPAYNNTLEYYPAESGNYTIQN
jgi:hypothetical protein